MPKKTPLTVKQDKESCFLLAAGGTGGHMFPAITLAKALIDQGAHLLFVTDKRGASFLPQLERTTVHLLRSTHFQGDLRHKLKAAWAFLRDGLTVPRLLYQRRSIQKVMGFGGFPSFWPVVWARLFKKPCALYQADAVMGRTNRFLAPWTHAVFLGFKATQAQCPKGKEVGLIARQTRPVALYPARKPEDPLHLLILGGSQGARFFSHVTPQAIRLLPEAQQRLLHITQQCRAEDQKSAEEAYRQTQAQFELPAFINDVHTALSDAHLVMARAGTGTISDLVHAGRPALFVPYPYAANNHQYQNALLACNSGGGWIKTQKDCSPSKLASFLQECLENPTALTDKAHRMQKAIPVGALAPLTHWFFPSAVQDPAG